MNTRNWRIAQASVVGLAHINLNAECQDRVSSRIINTAADGEVLIAVMADGAGSSERGFQGAEFACKLFIEEVSSFLDFTNASVKSLTEDFGERWISYFQQRIAEMAQVDGKALRDYASTLVAAVIGETSAVFYQIGDGGIVISNSGLPESYRFAVAPADSEYVNMTDFITDKAATERLRYSLIDERIEDLILFSDGIFPVAVDYQINQPHEPFLMPMIAPLRKLNSSNGNGAGGDLNEKLEKFLASPKLNEKTDDDKTIILASRAQQSINKTGAEAISEVISDRQIK